MWAKLKTLRAGADIARRLSRGSAPLELGRGRAARLRRVDSAEADARSAIPPRRLTKAQAAARLGARRPALSWRWNERVAGTRNGHATAAPSPYSAPSFRQDLTDAARRSQDRTISARVRLC